MSYQEKTGPLMANSHPGSYCGQDAYNDMLITGPQRERESMDNRERSDRPIVSTGEVRSVEYDARSTDSVDSDYIVRRLTPTECARLQGFPDDWCADVEHSDSAEYKLWGNGIALPCLLPMMKAMSIRLQEEI